ncbi:hypothetical protein [Pseudomonas chlororaphis]|uniref:Uncharacterized protein n=1 Tax=Pseudomonas chlororaphis TaxID=587753 RepID=A0A1Q8EQK9_9PSED|nr:hypothetical protein [Pseudomonas chlororaphis]OLF54076.1 hypothetical protein BTN82_13560 [Pseudomonas chlororaphis]
MNIPIPAQTPDPNIDHPTLPPPEPQPQPQPQPVPEQEPPESAPPPRVDPPGDPAPVVAARHHRGRSRGIDRSRRCRRPTSPGPTLSDSVI